MDLNVLDRTLRKLTESEERYRRGEVYSGWKMMGQRQVGGRLINTINIEMITDEEPGKGVPLSVGQAFFNVKKNSRFNPVPEHVHNYIELNYVYSGTCPQVVNGGEIMLKKGQVLVIDINTPHAISALAEDDIMMSVMVSHKYLHEKVFHHFSKDSILASFFINAITNKTQSNRYVKFDSENSRRIQMFFQEFFCEYLDPSINSTDILSNLFGLIIAELINVYENDMARDENWTTGTSIVPIMRYIEGNFKTCTQESTADFFHLNPNYLTSLLKKHTGLTYKQLIQSQKLKYAARLLKNTELSVTAAANECGYENVSFFYRKFQEFYGCSPKEFRGQD